LHRLPFSPELLEREFPPPHDHASLILGARALGLKFKQTRVKPSQLGNMALPLLVELNQHGAEQPNKPHFAIITAVSEGRLALFKSGSNQAQMLSLAEATTLITGTAWLAAPETKSAHDPDALGGMSATGTQAAGTTQTFGFKWFVPELLKHKRVWRDVLLASLALQIIALATPLFTQAVIDKVVVHRTQSTLIAIGVAMGVFVVFSSLLTWVRQYLVLHTGNRVDAVLGAAIWAHLLKLPLRYFQYRPTGVVAARLHAVETIREFVSGAAVTLVLDLPFLLICVALMLWYSVLLTSIALGILLLVGIASLVMAPVFQARLNEQFLLGARNQAFLTEHIAGFETVKSLQMEPQLRKRFGEYLATYLQSGFKTKQIGNTYSVFAGTMEQLLTLSILMVGAYIVMTEPTFTIGMLVAFQMFAGKLSQPVLRLVGLWTQFQQASLSVARLGDIMNAPAEPYAITPQRQGASTGLIEVQSLAFGYADDLPLLYKDLNITIKPGQSVAIMGPSGVGKSTLAKLLMGFYIPTSGQIKIDSIDARHLAANELRSYFGVVPQETILFSGSIFDNLRAANPAATFEQVAQACKLAGVHEVVEALPKGYQTEIGERGAGLSGGQKQRLAIARALLKGPKILIFDEATSALDQDTAEAFAKTVNGLRGKVTMLFITHALPKALQIDEVIHMRANGVQTLAMVPGAQRTQNNKNEGTTE
jgi:ATP-binding cassette, subfamily B, bacterial HlyB/CyaB